MKLYLKGFFLLNILLIPHVTNCQIKKDSISTGVNLQSEACIPPCREGYMCIKGECISKCNPPCPINMKCGSDGDCHEILNQGFSNFRKQGNVVGCIKRVDYADEVIQGFVFKTNRPHTEIQIGDTNFLFDNELYINAPARDYRMYLNAKGQNTKYMYEELVPGHSQEIKVTLRPVRLNIGCSIGTGYFRDLFGPFFNFDVGMTIASKHFFGITGSVSTLDDTTNIRDAFDSLIQNHHKIDFDGFGATYGYTGFHFKKITTIPKFAIGYWEANELLERLGRHYTDSTSMYNLNTITKSDIEHYFLKPGVEVQFGYRIVGFRMLADTFIGNGFGPFQISFGAIFRIL